MNFGDKFIEVCEWLWEHWEGVVGLLALIISYYAVRRGEVGIERITKQTERLSELVKKITTVFGLNQYLEFVKSFYKRASKRIVSVQRIWHMDEELREGIKEFATNSTDTDAKAIFCGPVDLEENLPGLFWRLHLIYCSDEIGESHRQKFEFLFDKTFESINDNVGKLRFTIADNNLLLASSLKPEQEVYGVPYENESHLADFYIKIFESNVRVETISVNEKLVALIKDACSGTMTAELLLNDLSTRFNKHYIQKEIHIIRHENPPSEDEFKDWVKKYLIYLANNQPGLGISYDCTTDKFTL